MAESSIELARDSNRSTLKFDSPQDVLRFLKQEDEFWTWTQGSEFDTNNQNVNNLVARYRPRWTNGIRNHVAQWKDAPDERTRQEARNEVANALRTRFVNERLLSSLDPEAAAVLELAKNDRNVGAVALAFLYGLPLLAEGNFLAYKANLFAVSKALLILSGVDSTSSDAAAASVRLRLDALNQDARQLSAVIEQTKAQARDITKTANELHAEQLASQDSEFKKQEEARQSLFKKLQKNIEALTAAYEIKMQLRGPVRYWQSKAKRHNTTKNIMAAVLLAYTVLATWGLVKVYDLAATHLPTNAGDQISYAALFKAGAFAILISSIAFWIGRVLLRIFLSNQHLATDADERMTMVMTFLALVRSKSIKDEERQAILTPLFRSAADGIVKDDTAPDTAFAALLGALIKDKKG